MNVPTLGGQVAMTIPEGTQNNRLLRLSGKGMPNVKGGGAGRSVRAADRPAPAEAQRQREEALQGTRIAAQRQERSHSTRTQRKKLT